MWNVCVFCETLKCFNLQGLQSQHFLSSVVLNNNLKTQWEREETHEFRSFTRWTFEQKNPKTSLITHIQAFQFFSLHVWCENLHVNQPSIKDEHKEESEWRAEGGRGGQKAELVESGFNRGQCKATHRQSRDYYSQQHIVFNTSTSRCIVVLVNISHNQKHLWQHPCRLNRWNDSWK